MDKIKAISKDKIIEIAVEKNFNPNLILKDYYLTIMLYLLKDVKGIYFKGGTALQKTILDYSRISEDIDLTVTLDMKKIKKEIIEILTNTNLFEKITKDKDVEGFTRLIFHYKTIDDKEDKVLIDLNARAKLSKKPERHKMQHFYQENIPEFTFNTLAFEEIIAEKMAATIGRNKPRDHYDLYKILKAKLPINLGLVKKKCKESRTEFNIIKMFNQANKLKSRWDEDLMPLLSEEISFKEVIRTLAKHFKLKEEKEKLKKKN
jgi:predicted nucleotidyltransferase component of viral defense system